MLIALAIAINNSKANQVIAAPIIKNVCFAFVVFPFILVLS